jgi:hypothetical protein
MSTFESDNYRWRETYFVLFEESRTPTLKQVEQKLRKLSDRFQLSNLSAADDGSFESLTLLAPDDYAAIDISYIEGEEVIEQAVQLAKDMKNASLQPSDFQKLARLPKCTARFDVMHFEQIPETADEDEGDEMLDPSALLVVLDALVELTDGIGVDPQSGALM